MVASVGVGHVVASSGGKGARRSICGFSILIYSKDSDFDVFMLSSGDERNLVIPLPFKLHCEPGRMGLEQCNSSDDRDVTCSLFFIVAFGR